MISWWQDIPEEAKTAERKAAEKFAQRIFRKDPAEEADDTDLKKTTADHQVCCSVFSVPVFSSLFCLCLLVMIFCLGRFSSMIVAMIGVALCS